MLGNWSVGKDDQQGYFKEKAIEYALEFFCDVLGLEKDKIWVTIFKGEKNIPKDEESIQIWQKILTRVCFPACKEDLMRTQLPELLCV